MQLITYYGLLITVNTCCMFTVISEQNEFGDFRLKFGRQPFRAEAKS